MPTVTFRWPLTAAVVAAAGSTGPDPVPGPSWDRTFQCTAALLIGDIRCPVQTGDGLWGDRLASFGRSVPVLLISGDGADIGQGPRYQL
jgi:hypothetical protein